MTAMDSNRFQSTLPVRGATKSRNKFFRIVVISIHAPREGSDGENNESAWIPQTISIHAPREGSDLASTARPFLIQQNFNPRSP